MFVCLFTDLVVPSLLNWKKSCGCKKCI
jgi:hypothetical protein